MDSHQTNEAFNNKNIIADNKEESLLSYNVEDGFEAFTTKIQSTLPYYVIQPHQIHSDGIAIVNDRNTRRAQLEGIDALITNLAECPIGVRTADCVPILLYDTRLKVVAAVHSGWRGTVLRVSEKVVAKMKETYGTNPTDLKAIIGPSIGPDSFFVHRDVVESFQEASFPMDIICRNLTNGSYIIDLWMANQWLLEQSGLKKKNINVVGICTFVHHYDFFSARYEKNNKCGRNINVINIVRR